MDNKVDPASFLQLSADQTVKPAVEAGPADRLDRLEVAVQRAEEGLRRWLAGCFEQVSSVPLAGAEITLLLLIGSGGQSKTIKDLAWSTNRTDIPNIQYSLRKLASAGLTRKQGAGRSGVTYSLTEEGTQLAGRIRNIRERLLLQELAGRPELSSRLANAAEALEELTDLYRAAARQAEMHSWA